MASLADLQALALAGAYVAGVSLAFAGNRTALHVGTAQVVWLGPLFEDPRVALAGLLLLAGAAAWAWLRTPRLYLDVLGGERDAGPAMFFLGLAVAAAPWALGALAFDFVLVAVLPMAFADPVGFYAGRAWGRHRLTNGKSAEGFAAVALVSLAVLLAWRLGAAGSLGVGGFLAFGGVALATAAAETLAPRHLDNLLMPLAGLGTAVLLFVLLGAA